jgi:hypothetical protein
MERTKQTKGSPSVDWKSVLCNPDQQAGARALLVELDRGTDVNARSANGKCALHYAAKFDNIPAAKLLLGRGADPDAQFGRITFGRLEKLKWGWMPLHYAVRSDSRAMVRLLLLNGADPKRFSFQNETPSEVAWIEHREEALLALVEFEAMCRGPRVDRLFGRRDIPENFDNLQLPPWVTRLSFPRKDHINPILHHLEQLLWGAVSLADLECKGRTNMLLNASKQEMLSIPSLIADFTGEILP